VFVLLLLVCLSCCGVCGRVGVDAAGSVTPHSRVVLRTTAALSAAVALAIQGESVQCSCAQSRDGALVDACACAHCSCSAAIVVQ
jgi:hypothetical protein